MFKLDKSLRIPELKVPSTTLTAAENWEYHESNVVLGRTEEISNAVSLTLAHVYLAEEIKFVLVVYSGDAEYAAWMEGLVIMVPENNYRVVNIGPRSKRLSLPELPQGSTSSSSSSSSSSSLSNDGVDRDDDEDGKRLEPLDPECVCFVFVHVVDLEAQFPYYEQLKEAGCVPLETDSDTVLEITQYDSSLRSDGVCAAMYPLRKRHYLNALPYSHTTRWDLLVLSLSAHSFAEDRVSVYALNALFCTERLVFLRPCSYDFAELWSLLGMVSPNPRFYDDENSIHSYISDDIAILAVPDHCNYEALVSIHRKIDRKRAHDDRPRLIQPKPIGTSFVPGLDFGTLAFWDEDVLKTHTSRTCANNYTLLPIPTPDEELFDSTFVRGNLKKYARDITNVALSLLKMEAVNTFILMRTAAENKAVVTPASMNTLAPACTSA